MSARYEGKPQVEFSPQGRNVILLADLFFFDKENVRWGVPKGATVDGASIPPLFWPIIGGPFEGKYRDASIIHDWFCDIRTRAWQATHRVFYEAMCVSGVGIGKAKLLYFAVWWRGPRWEERVSCNTRLPVDPALFQNIRARRKGSEITTRSVPSPGEGFEESEQLKILSEVRPQIERNQYSLDQIEELAEATRQTTEPQRDPRILDALGL